MTKRPNINTLVHAAEMLLRIKSLESITDPDVRKQLNHVQNICRTALEPLQPVEFKPAGFDQDLYLKRCKIASTSLFESFNTDRFLREDETILRRSNWEPDDEDKNVILCTVEISSKGNSKNIPDNESVYMVVKFEPDTDRIIYSSIDGFEIEPDILEFENRQAQELLQERFIAANNFYKIFINDFNFSHSDSNQYSPTNSPRWYNRHSATRWQCNIDLKLPRENRTTVDMTLCFASDNAEIIAGTFDGREITSLMSRKDVSETNEANDDNPVSEPSR